MFDKDNKFGFINNNDNSNNTDIKKYVDDNTVIHPLPIYKISESPSMITYMVNIMDLKKLTTYGAIRDMNSAKYQRYRFIYPCDDGKNKTIVNTGDDINDTTFRVYHYDTSSTLTFNNVRYTVDYTKHSTSTDVIVTKSIQNYLGIYNTQEYTPTENYNPATKKYVDDNKIAYTISSKKLATVSASDIVLDNPITVNNFSVNKNRKYYIEFLGSKKLCNVVISEDSATEISCTIGNYEILGIIFSSNLMLGVHTIKTDITTTDTFTDLIIYEEEIKCLDNKYLENDLVIQNSISLGRRGDIEVASSAIGMDVEATGMASHAEGYGTIASGNFSHAEGSFTEARAEDSHAEGSNTIASFMYQHVQGKYNIEDTNNKYAHIVGNGEDENTRSNAHTLDWEGNAWYAGEVQATNLPYSVSSKVLTTVPAKDIKLGKINNINNVSINKDRRYYIEFLGSKKLCSVMMSKETGDSIVCSIDDYVIQVFNRLTDLALFIRNTNTEDAPISTDLVIYEEEVKYLDSKYLENNLVAQNSISLGRTGDIGMASVAIGIGVEASGNGSFAQGGGAKASNNSAHAEGMNTIASGNSSHAEGNGTVASGTSSHAEGSETTASGEYGSHAEGYKTKAEGESSHAEGDHTTASGNSSHTEGSRTIASGIYSHAEGSNTTASGDYSHSEGEGTTASSQNQHVQGKYNIEDTNNKYAHIVGNGDIINKSNAHTLDWEGNAWYAGEVQGTNLPYSVSSKKLATILASNIVLDNEVAVNNISINKDRRYYIEFLGSKKICSLLVSEEMGNAIICSIGGYEIQVINNSPNIQMAVSKINKDDTTATTFTDLVIYEEEVKYLDNKYLETDLTLQNSISLGRVGDIGTGSSAIGIGVEASGIASHAEGMSVTSSGMCSHAEGNFTKASGDGSHVEGDGSIASGDVSHAEGACTIASGECSHVQGKFNIEDKANKYAHIVGNGEDDSTRANAHTLDWQGNGWYAGKLTQEGTPTDDKDLATKKYVDDNILLEQLPILRIDETNKRIYVNCNNMGTYKKYFVPNKYANVYGFSFIYTNEDSSETEIALIGGAMTRDDFILCARNTDTLFILILGGTDKYKYTKSTKTLEKGLYGYLKIGNTQEYAPTENYNPATKKYVDDKVASLPQLSFNENGELVVTINGVSKTFVPKE